ncbi:hypothetical protein MESS4_40011 [Mesorhizobium sp. STM 4661]|nr:hypothetical protein MESS4_40011 [Mesorhizobium sp. STM 4661]
MFDCPLEIPVSLRMHEFAAAEKRTQWPFAAKGGPYVRVGKGENAEQLSFPWALGAQRTRRPADKHPRIPHKQGLWWAADPRDFRRHCTWRKPV